MLKRALTIICVIWHEEVFVWRGRKSLRSSPSHILHGEEGPIVHKNVVEETVADYGALRPFNDTGKDTESRGRRGVGGQDAVAALLPLLHRCVYCLLNISPVEVD